MQAVLDLQVSIGMEYGTTRAAITAWDLLPNRDSHPSGGSPYCYFITFTSLLGHGRGFGSTDFMRSSPICTVDDLRAVEEYLRSWQQASELYLLSCKSLKETTPGSLLKYEQGLRESM